MSRPLDPSIMLATSMHAQPGVYAVLVGSGVSRASGIPTGWGIVEALVSRIAAQTGSPLQSSSEAEAWWSDHYDEPLGYSTLLAKLAPSAPARQGLLAPFFELSDDDDADLKRPTAAHRAIANLVKRGTVRVIVTTNFDRLIEQALTEVGIEPQVLSRPDAVSGMRPLAHAPVTVIKLHGDYLDVESLNTDEELAHYPASWNTLLAQIFEEYGLVIAGWSAEWDTALVAAIEDSPSRRYPLYWDSRSSRGVNASRLLALRRGSIMAAAGADEMFTTLVSNLEALDSLAEPPLTTAIAVARLKKYLPDPLRRIDLFDLIQNQTGAVKTATDSVGSMVNVDMNQVDSAISDLAASTTPLLRLLTEGVFHDDGTHDALWVRTLQTLLLLRTAPSGAFNNSMRALQHLPAQLALIAMGAVAISEHRDGLLVQLAQEPQWQSPYSSNVTVTSGQVLHLSRVVDHDLAQTLPRWNGTRWNYPQSELLRSILTPVLEEVLPSERLEIAFDDVEYRLAVLQSLHPSAASGRHPHAGRYLGDYKWDNDGAPFAEKRLIEASVRPGIATAYTTDDAPDLVQTLTDMRPALSKMQRW